LKAQQPRQKDKATALQRSSSSDRQPTHNRPKNPIGIQTAKWIYFKHKQQAE